MLPDKRATSYDYHVIMLQGELRLRTNLGLLLAPIAEAPDRKLLNNPETNAETVFRSVDKTSVNCHDACRIKRMISDCQQEQFVCNATKRERMCLCFPFLSFSTP